MAGYTISKDNIQNRCGDVAASALRLVAEIRKVADFLDSTPNATLTTTYGLSDADVADLKSSFTDLKSWANVFEGLGTRAAAYDHRVFVKRLIGVAQY